MPVKALQGFGFSCDGVRRECKRGNMCVHPDHLGWATHSANVKHSYKKRKRGALGADDKSFGD
jgi:hypothetical protein